jgi:type I restriction enzyme, S subunit
MRYRLRHLVLTKTEKVDVDPAFGRVDLEDVESGTGKLVTDLGARQQRSGEGVAFRRGDVLVGKLRPYLRKGLLAESDGCCSPELVVMRPHPTLVDARFVHYLTLSDPFVAWAVATSKGVKMPRTSAESLCEFRLELPTLSLQREVAARLDRETGRLNQLLEVKHRTFALLRERFQALNDRLVYAGDGHVEMVPLMHLVDPARSVMYGIVLPGPNVPEGVLLVKGGDVDAGRLTADQLARTTPEIEAPYARARL